MSRSQKLIAREKEASTLRELVSNSEAQMISLYGRRRIGKTFLVRSLFKENPKYLYFEATGLKRGSRREQIEIVTKSIADTFYNGIPLAAPETWFNTFELLNTCLQKVSKKVVLFFDELPWLAHKRKEVVDALEYYWNSKWEMNPRVKIILCGSAASWMIDNIVNNKGGLHNRVTKIMRLNPFDLGESKKFIIDRIGKISLQQLLEIYLVLGGIPHYLKEIRKGESAMQAINRMCFSENGLLNNEYENLVDSLFDSSEDYKRLLTAIGLKRYGVTRDDLVKTLKSSSGGTLSKKLDELEQSGFIWSFKAIGAMRGKLHYRLLDPYLLFHLTWLERAKGKKLFQKNYWLLQRDSGAFYTWAGNAFELVCFQHYNKIAEALGIGDITYSAKTYFSKDVQADLIFDRADNCISLCELKYSDKPLKLDKNLALELKKRLERFVQDTKTRKNVFLSIVAPHGVSKSVWSEDLVDSVVSIDQLV